MRKILVIIDMQNDFITGALGSEEAQKILPSVLQYAQNFSGEILFTRRYASAKLFRKPGREKTSYCSLCRKNSWMGVGRAFGRIL